MKPWTSVKRTLEKVLHGPGTVSSAHPVKSKADYQSNVAFRQGSNPGTAVAMATQIANELEEKVKHQVQVKATTRGFIELTLKDEWLCERVQEAIEKSQLDRVLLEERKQEHVLVDYSSPNMAKELHVGHLRSTIIGNSLCNVLEYLGDEVQRVSHVGDFGTPMGMMVAELGKRQQRRVEEEELAEMYPQAKRRYEQDSEFAVAVHEAANKLQQGPHSDAVVWELYSHICEQSRRSYGRVYERLHIQNLEERGESFYRDMVGPVVKELVKMKLARESEGAIVVSSEIHSPMIVQKSDGSYLYATTDLAAMRHRLMDEKCDRIVYVVDKSQSSHFASVFETGKRAGWWTSQRVTHAAFGLVLGADGKKLSSRAGGAYSLMSLLDDAVTAARRVSRPSSSGAVEESFEIIGINAVKYFDLAHNRLSDYAFNLDHMLALKGNTAVYIMYAMSRIRSLFRASARRESACTHWEVDSAHRLAVLISEFPDVLEAVDDQLQPMLLCDYLHRLATKVHLFYESDRILGSPSEPQSLWLLGSALSVMERGMKLLGLQSVERI